MSHDPAAERRAGMLPSLSQYGTGVDQPTVAPPRKPVVNDSATTRVSGGAPGVRGAGKGMTRGR